MTPEPVDEDRLSLGLGLEFLRQAIPDPDPDFLSRLSEAIRRGRGRPVVLVVDDEEAAREILRVQLEARNFEVDTLPSGDEALSYCLETIPDILIVDQRMPEMMGTELIRRLRAAGMEAPAVIFSSVAHELQAEAAGLGVHAISKTEWDQLFTELRTLQEL